MRHQASRMRDPLDRFTRLHPTDRHGCVLHWSTDSLGGTATHVSVVESLMQIVSCQPWEFAIAAVDSALNKRLVVVHDLERIFASRPQLRRRVDGRCESGLESITRLIAEDLGYPVRTQVAFEGIGRVDLIVAGRVVVETDGRLGHGDSASLARDYSRDAALAALGYTVLRFSYAQVIHQRWMVESAIRASVAVHRRGR